MKNAEPSQNDFSRRDFLKGIGVAGVLPSIIAEPARSEEAETELRTFPPEGKTVTLNINKKKQNVFLKPSDTLLSVLREKLHLTGSKEVCGKGACGACTVLLNNRSVNSCMILAVDALDTKITTIEGLASGEELDPVQKAYMRHDASQCGYCTLGFIMRTRAMLNETPQLTDEEIKSGLAGNICRCGAYKSILAAVKDVAK